MSEAGLLSRWSNKALKMDIIFKVIVNACFRCFVYILF